MVNTYKTHTSKRNCERRKTSLNIRKINIPGTIFLTSVYQGTLHQGAWIVWLLDASIWLLWLLWFLIIAKDIHNQEVYR